MSKLKQPESKLWTRKVCFVLENAMGGIATVVINQIKLLDPEVFNCTVVLLNFSWRKVASARRMFEEAGMSVVEFNISHESNKLLVLKDLAERHLKVADLIIASTKYELTGYGIARLNNPVIMMLHGDTEPVKEMIVEFQDVVHKIIAISQFLMEWACQLVSSSNRDKVIYLPHAIKDASVRKQVRADNLLHMIFIGRYNETKGADYLLKIGKRLGPYRDQLKFILITDGVDTMGFMNNWPLHKQSSFHADIQHEQVQELLSKSDIILMPSRNEGFPIALIEAMRSGVVPICSDLRTGFSEVVKNGHNGYLVQVGNIDGFIDRILELMKNASLLSSMSIRVVDAIKQNFDPSKNIEAYKKLYLDVAENSRTYAWPNRYSTLGKLDRNFIPHWGVRLLKQLTSLGR